MRGGWEWHSPESEKEKACSTCNSIRDLNHPSGFREAFAKVFGTAPSLAHDVDCLYAKWFETPLGPMLALANDAGLYLLEFVDRRGLEREVQALRRRLTQHVVPGEHRYLDRIGEELDALFRGPLADIRNTAPARRLAVPARGMGDAARDSSRGDACLRRRRERKSDAARRCVRVGRANGDNKLAIIVPCHRVIGADGTLTGYGGGLWRKAWLLEHERTFTRARGQLAWCRHCRLPPRLKMPLADLARLLALAALWGSSFAFIRVAAPSSGRSGSPKAGSLSRLWSCSCWRCRAARSRRCASAGETSWSSASSIPALPFALFCFAGQYIAASTAAILNANQSVFRRSRRGAVARRIRCRCRSLLGMALRARGVVLLVGWRPEPLTRSRARGGVRMPCRLAVLRHCKRLRKGAHDRRAQLLDCACTASSPRQWCSRRRCRSLLCRGK